jgi:hypothetical protein
MGNTDLSPNLDRQNGLYPPRLGSACIDSGINANWMTGATDIAGATRVIHGTVDIGACEYVTPDVLTCGFTAAPIAGIDALDVMMTAAVAGPGQNGLVYFWDFENDGTYDVSGSGYGTVVHPYVGGIHSIRLRVVNDQSVEAEALQVNAVTVAASATHVVTNNAGAAYPYATWATAATRVQDAAGAVVDNGTVWVSNGVYKLASTLVIARPITVRSVNGWMQTTLSGNNSVRTVNLQSSGAVIDGFTIRDGSLAYGLGQNLYLQPGTAKNSRITACKINSAQGGGVCADGGHLVNCIVDGNTVNGQGPAGVDLRNASTMVNCLVTGNKRTAGSSFWGGGVRAQSASAAIRNCTITDNWEYDATKGSGLQLDQAATVVNCIIARNGRNGAPADFANNLLGKTNNVSYTCVWPPAFNYAALTKMVTSDPRFMDPAGGNFRLNKLSPCRNQGLYQSWMLGAVDLDGAVRVDHKEAVDLGAYEAPYHAPGAMLILR